MIYIDPLDPVFAVNDNIMMYIDPLDPVFTVMI